MGEDLINLSTPFNVGAYHLVMNLYQLVREGLILSVRPFDYVCKGDIVGFKMRIVHSDHFVGVLYVCVDG